MSAITMAREVVPFGVETMVVCSQSGALSGMRFWKKLEPVTPFGKRCSKRRTIADGAHDRRLDGQVVVGEVELGDPRVREHDLRRAGDLDGVAGGRQLDGLAVLGALGHQMSPVASKI